MAEKCTCVSNEEWNRIKRDSSIGKYTGLMAFGMLFGGFMAYVYETIFLLFIPTVYVVIIFAPIIEEIIKSFMVLGETTSHGILYTILAVTVGYALGEWLVHMYYLGGFFFSILPALHIVFTLPLIAIYRKEQTRKSYIMGLSIAILLHLIYNLAYWYS